jgi:hypothetical protein
MMWGCIIWEGAKYAYKIDGKMDRNLYMQILHKELQESIKFYLGEWAIAAHGMYESH